MSHMPRMTGKDVVRVLEHNGFVAGTTSCGNRILRHGDGRQTVVPGRSEEIVSSGLLARILCDCKLWRQQLLDTSSAETKR